MNLPPISRLLPHRRAMVLLDRLVAVDGESLCAELRVGPDCLFYDGRGVGAWVGLEYMAQAIAAHAGYGAYLDGTPVKVGFLLGSRRYQCTEPSFKLGTVLRVFVRRALLGENGLGAFECRIDDVAMAATVATATITVFQPEDVNNFLQRSEQ